MNLDKRLRLCEVGGEVGYFHCWEEYADVISPSLTIGGHPGGQLSRTYAIVEFKNEIRRVNISELKFVDEMSMGLYAVNSERSDSSSINLKNIFATMGLPDFNTDNISDGCHTFGSLYYQRLILFATLVNSHKDISWKSKLHHDGKVPFDGGWFIVGIETPKGPYTYHYDLKYWDLFECKELDHAPEWDGHTDKDVERLLSLC